MDGMFLGLAALLRDIVAEDTTTDPSPVTTTELAPLTTQPIANTTNETIVVLILEPEDEMHHTTATGLAVTGLIVLIAIALFALCFLLRKYCRCAYDLRYSLNYGKVPRGAVLVPTEDQLEAGEVSKRSTFIGADSGIGINNSRYPSEARPQTPSSQRPPRPPPSNRGSLQRQSAEQRPLIAPADAATLSVQQSGLYPTADSASRQVDETKTEARD